MAIRGPIFGEGKIPSSIAAKIRFKHRACYKSILPESHECKRPMPGTIPNNTTTLCRSQLAGDGACKVCIDFEAVIAGKPAPTRVLWRA
jgi:hypothetical protein